MDEAVQEGTRLWSLLGEKGIGALTLSDVIWIIGVISLLILAFRVVRKAWKVLLVLAAVALAAYWLVKQGWLPL